MRQALRNLLKKWKNCVCRRWANRECILLWQVLIFWFFICFCQTILILLKKDQIPKPTSFWIPQNLRLPDSIFMLVPTANSFYPFGNTGSTNSPQSTKKFRDSLLSSLFLPFLWHFNWCLGWYFSVSFEYIYSIFQGEDSLENWPLYRVLVGR